MGFAAFAPALGLMAYRVRGTGWMWAFGLAGAFGILVLVGAAFIVRSANTEPYEFGDIEDVADEVLGYISAYLLPAFVDDPRSTEQMVLSTLIIALILHIHIATGRVYINPILYLFGYRIYRAECGDTSFYLVARTDTSTWRDRRNCVRIASSVLVERDRLGTR